MTAPMPVLPRVAASMAVGVTASSSLNALCDVSRRLAGLAGLAVDAGRAGRGCCASQSPVRRDEAGRCRLRTKAHATLAPLNSSCLWRRKFLDTKTGRNVIARSAAVNP